MINRFGRIAAASIIASVSFGIVNEVPLHDLAMLPSDGGQPHVPAEGPSPSSEPMTPALASYASGTVTMVAGGGYTGSTSFIFSVLFDRAEGNRRT
jgi:hypothetical protein